MIKTVRRCVRDEWHKWFAWYPIYIPGGREGRADGWYDVRQRVWLQYVWRERQYGRDGRWAYSLLQPRSTQPYRADGQPFHNHPNEGGFVDP